MFQSAAGLPVLPLVGAMLGVAALAALAVFFKPLLSGLAKAAVLVVRPRLSREEQAARRHLRDTRLMKRMINSAHGISQTAELHALAARV
jgi:hypothetical protein